MASELTFGEMLRSLRLRRGMSPEQVATDIRLRFGEGRVLSVETLRHYEAQSTPPWPRIVTLLAQYYDVPNDYFTRGKSAEEVEEIRRLNSKSLYEVRKGW